MQAAHKLKAKQAFEFMAPESHGPGERMNRRSYLVGLDHDAHDMGDSGCTINFGYIELDALDHWRGLRDYEVCAVFAGNGGGMCMNCCRTPPPGISSTCAYWLRSPVV
jgi:hypothetical protein